MFSQSHNGQAASNPLQSAARPAQASLFNLLGLGLIIVLCGLLLAYFIDASIEPPATPTISQFQPPFQATTIGGTELIVPKSWFRNSLRLSGNFADQASLAVRVRFNQVAPLQTIDVTFLPLSAAQPSASLLDSVYLRQFQPQQVSGPSGLIGKPLTPKDGFANETVWYDPLSAYPFVAKCMAPLVEGQPQRCMRTIRAKGSLSVTYEFDFAALQSWRAFDAVLSPYLAAAGAL